MHPRFYRPRPPTQTYRGARVPMAVSPEVTRGLRAMARHADATLFMVLLGAFTALLSRYGDLDDVASTSNAAVRVVGANGMRLDSSYAAPSFGKPVIGDEVIDGWRVSTRRVFAVIGGPPLTTAWADQLAERGIICLGCGLGVPDSRYQDNAPYMWGTQPTPEQFLVNFGDYLVKRLF